MSLAAIRSVSSERFRQARAILSLIRAREEEEKLTASEDTKALRGLFLVNLYAAFEFSINLLVQEALQEIQQMQPHIVDVDHRFHSIALSHLFQSYATSGDRKRWKKRIELLEHQTASRPCTINNTVFSEYLQNVWSETIVDVCTCFSLDIGSEISATDLGYVDDVVERRNAVAHGRESPIDVGERFSLDDLEKRFAVLNSVTIKLIDLFESHISTAGFVKLERRPLYAQPQLQ